MRNKIANLGDEIISISEIKGIVQKIYQNSVLINITENNSGKEFLNNKTIISHKKYLIANK
ncbi:DUF2187 family protein [Bacillus sp. FJAT-49736]|uniref:DUF2187 family protein n=1 Tax=Bacillus sp. FJAT-49736 TaxID=2833582 RepID=UPI001BC94B68|nr:DUF2187 family protein [Bacillus sp. FJAT-49736]MBS4174323.1 DUF2187 family protein [Bacillus sp. FJAT-49736]